MVPSCRDDLGDGLRGLTDGGNLDGANRELSALHVRRLQGILSPSIPHVLSTPHLNPPHYACELSSNR